MSQFNTILKGQITAVVNGEAASQEENDRLYPGVVARDEASINRMIEINMPLVIDKVDTYIACWPSVAHLRDDLIAEGFLGLTTAVRKMSEEGPKENANATGYISYWIHKSLGAVADSEQRVLGFSARTEKRRQDDGLSTFFPKEIANSESTCALDFEIEYANPMAIPDLWDTIYACCESETDRTIVKMRSEDYNDQEIAERLGLPRTTTYMLRRAIYARFLQKSEMSGEV